MSETTNLRLPYLAASQAQKHVTVNEGLRELDVLVQTAVESMALSAPPASPADGQVWIVGAAPTGAWVGCAGSLAAWQDGAWAFFVPKEGWRVWNRATGQMLIRQGGSWLPQQNFAAATLGLGGAAGDATNRLSINAPATLLNNAGASHEVTINKAAAGNDAALAFKTGFSARALFGLLGSDDFSVKVSPDGSSFFDALIADRASGRIRFPAGVALTGLAADPASPADGWLWHNGATGQLRARLGGLTKIVANEDIPWLAPVAGDYALTTSGAGGGATGTLTGVAGRMEIFPFSPRGDIAVDRLAVNVTTLLAAALGKIVVYGSDANGRPGNRIVETGDLDFGIAGVREATVALTLRRGTTYWLGVRHSSTATISAWASSATPDLNGGAPAITARKVLRQSLAYATAAPGTWTYASADTNAGPAAAIWLRAA